MTKETMTIHQALCELKTLDARINSAIDGNNYVFANKHANTKVGGVEIGKICDEIKARYEQANDLIRRRDALKRAVVLSNAVTQVTIDGQHYTVAEAIELKNHQIPILKKILNRMTMMQEFARREADRSNGDALEGRADGYIRSLYGDKTDLKNMGDDIRRTRDEFIKQQTVEIVDPLDITARMKELEDRINGFVVNIDSALSVSNALTSIEIEY